MGANISFDNLPTIVSSLPVTVTGIGFTIDGTVDGKAFTRNPTSCGTATTTLAARAVLWPNPTTTASDSFTPTGCDRLPYAPHLSADANVSGFAGNIGLDTTIVQNAGEAVTRSVKLALPGGIYADAALFAGACTSSDLQSCPASSTVETATVTTLLLAHPVSGRVVLTGDGSGAGIAAVFPDPFGISLRGTPQISGWGASVSFTKMPDLPLTKVTVKLSGGPSSLLVGGYDWCNASQALTGRFDGHNGAATSVTAPLPLSGCPSIPGWF